MSQQAYPKISIVTPSYNQTQFLERTILSVLNQNYPKLEYLIIDGGSTDGSVDIIKKYERYLAYWVSEKDAGQSEALNKGFIKATGEIIGWQNSDDVYLPGAFKKAQECFKAYPQADIVYSNRLDINEYDQVTGEVRYAPFSRLVYRYDGLSISNQSAFWKGDLFQKIGLLDPSVRFVMDYEFFMRAALHGDINFHHVRDFWGAARRYAVNRTDCFMETPQFKRELSEIDSRYGRARWSNLPLKLYALLYRSFHYALQGDSDYLLRGVVRRIKRSSILSGA